MNIDFFTIKQYQVWLKNQGLSNRSIKRKLVALKKYCSWLKKEKIIDKNPFEDRKLKSASPSNRKLKSTSPLSIILAKLFFHLRYTRPKWYERYHESTISKYLNISILIIFAVALGIFGYEQFIKRAERPLAYPAATSPTTPNRYLSFQGRLTDSSDNPITVATDMRFALYNDSTASGSAQLWEEQRVVTPDEDGIFSIILGTTNPIPTSVFTDNANLWLGVTVETDPEMTPRQQIATVGYALNAETLQGIPPSASPSANRIPIITQSGDLVLAGASPLVYSTSGTFGIKGQAITISTDTGTNGNIVLAPDGTGVLNINLGGSSGNQVRVTNANITSGNFVSVYAGTDSTGFDLLSLSAGASEGERFRVTAEGDMDLARAATIAGSLKVDTDTLYVDDVNNRVGIGTTGPVQKLHVEGQCVTGDTELAIFEDHSSQITVHGVKIKDIKPGALVYSRNEETGKVETRKINKLLDMGIKPVFKLTTEGGKEIRTTGNHPYLVQLTQDEYNQRVQLRETGYLERKYGLSKEDLSVAREFSETREVWVDGSAPQSSNLDTSEYSRGEREIQQQGVYPVSLSCQGQSLRDGCLSETGAGVKVSDRTTGSASPSTNSQNLSNDGWSHQLPQEIRWTKVIYLSPGDPIATVSFCDQSTVNCEPYVVWDKDTPDGVDHSSQITDHGKSQNICEPSTVNCEPYVVWDKIKSIEYVGWEQVYDIEVEGTHNFVANGILAHNTYISGNVGIGTTEPNEELDIAGDATISGTLALGPNVQAYAGTCNASSAGKMYYDGDQNKYYYCNGSSWTEMGGGGGSGLWEDGTYGVYEDDKPVIVGADEDFSHIAEDIGDLRVASDLEVIGTSYFGDASNYLTISNGGDLSFYGTADTIDVSNVTDTKLVITGGNVGIGTTDPSNFKLQVAGNVGPNADSSYNLGSSSLRWATVYADNLDLANSDDTGLLTTDFLQVNRAATLSAQIASDKPLVVNAVSGQTANIVEVNSVSGQGGDYLVVDNGGNVGIGTTSPGTLFDVQGAAQFGTDDINLIDSSGKIAGLSTTYFNQDTSANLAGIITDETGSGLLVFNASPTLTTPTVETSLTVTDDDWIGLGSSAGRIEFDDQTTDEVNILGANVGIGTTSPASFKLQVAGNVGPDADSSYDLGSSSLRWATVYTNNLDVSSAISTPQLTTDFLEVNRAATLSAQIASDKPLVVNAVSGQTANIMEVNSVSGQEGDYLVVDNGGNVGIGTTNPEYELDVSGTGQFTEMRFGTSGRIYQDTFVRFENTSGVDLLLGTYGQITGALLGSRFDSFSDLELGTQNASSVTIGQSDIDTVINGKVGIGTASPVSKLHLSGAVTGKALAIFDETGDQDIFTASASGTPRFVIKNSGNVGIGTTSPGAKLHVSGGDMKVTSATPLLTFSETDHVDWQWKVDGDQWLVQRAGVDKFVITGENLHFKQGYLQNNEDTTVRIGATAANSNLRFMTGGTNDRMTIDSSGNVGIGTTSPTSFKLQVTGDIGPNADSSYNLGSSSLRWATVYADSLDLANSDDTGLLTTDFLQVNRAATLSAQIASDKPLIVNAVSGQTANIVEVNSVSGQGGDYLVVNSSGNVGIGTTDPGSYKLYVNGDTYINGGLTSSGNLTSSELRSNGNIYVNYDGPDGDSYLYFYDGTSATGQYLMWDDAPGYFVLSGALKINGDQIYNSGGTSKLNLSSNYLAGGNWFVSSGSLSVNSTTAPSGGALYVNGNVGIGTTSPSTLFYGDYSVDGAGVSNVFSLERTDPNTPLSNFGVGLSFLLDRDDISASATESGRIAAIMTDIPNRRTALTFSTANAGTLSEAIRIDYNGNVGIGTTEPGAILHTYTSSRSTAIFETTDATRGHIRLLQGGSTAIMGLEGGKQYFGVGASLGISYAELVIDGNGGNVGIGTTDPGYKLDVVGDIQVDSKLIGPNTSTFIDLDDDSGTFDSGTNEVIFATVNDLLISIDSNNNGGDAAFVVGKDTTAPGDANWTELFRIQENGNVGIGTTSPGDTLDVNGSVIFRGDKQSSLHGTSYTSDEEVIRIPGPTSDYIISVQDGSGRIQHYWNSTTLSTTNKYLVADEDAGMIDWSPPNDPYLEIKYAPDGTEGNDISWTTHFAIKQNGNVGIGTTSPAGDLTIGTDTFNHVGGSGVSPSGLAVSQDITFGYELSGTNNINVLDGSTHTLNIRNAYYEAAGTDNALNVKIYGDLYLESSTGISGGKTTMGNLYTDGNVGIGTTSPGNKLDVNATSEGILIHGHSDIHGQDRLNLIEFGDGNSDYQILHQNSGALGRNTLALHCHDNDALGFYSSGWQTLFEIAGGTAQAYFSGNVGIGTTSPGARLYVKSDNENNTRIAQDYYSSDNSAVYTELAQRGWESSAGILFNAYKSGNESGNLFYTGNTKYKYPAGNYTRGAAAIGVLLNHGDGGHVNIYAAPSGTPDTDVTWTQLASFTRGGISLRLAGSSTSGSDVRFVDGQVTYYTSSLRYKTDIRDISTLIDTSKIYDLKPVSFKPLDSDTYNYGLIAEETYKVIPQLVVLDDQGRPDAIHYSDLSVLLLNEMIKNKPIIDSINLSSTGDIQLTSSQVNGLTSYELKDKNNNIIDRIGAFAELVVAKIKAGLVETTNLIAENIVSDKLISPLVETDNLIAQTIETEMIKPIADEDLIINLQNSQFSIFNLQNEKVASIDNQGNATLSGQLTAKEGQFNNITVEQLNASVGKFGQLMADKIFADSIEGLEAKIASIAANSYYFDEATPETTSDEVKPLYDEDEDASASALLSQIENCKLKIENYLNLSSLDADSVMINDFLAVFGQATITNLEITNSLSTPGVSSPTPGVGEGSILYLQPSGLGGINMLAGKFVIDESGDIHIQGDVYVAGKVHTEGLETKEATVSGSLFANLLKPIEGDLTIQLSTPGVNKETPGVKIRNSLGNEVASIDASGSATFRKLNIATAEATSSGTGFGQIVEPEITTNATAGKAILPAFETEITIKSPFVTDKSLIYITPETDTQNQVLYVKTKTGGQFSVAINRPLEHEVKFNWWIIN